MTLDLTEEDHKALRFEAAEADVPMAETLRQLVSLWREDPRLQKKIRTRYLDARGG